MTIWLIVLEAVSALAQIVGFVLLLTKALKARRYLKSGTWGVIDGGDAAGNSHYAVTQFDVIELLLRDAAGAWWAFGLIALGIVAGSASAILQIVG